MQKAARPDFGQRVACACIAPDAALVSPKTRRMSRIASALTLTRASLTGSDTIMLATFEASAMAGLLAQWWVVRKLFAE